MKAAKSGQKGKIAGKRPLIFSIFGRPAAGKILKKKKSNRCRAGAIGAATADPGKFRCKIILVTRPGDTLNKAHLFSSHGLVRIVGKAR